MMIPPSILWLQFPKPNHYSCRLWLPLFLILWPLLLIATVIIGTIWLLTLPLLVWSSNGRRLLALPLALYQLLCSFRGTKINVEDEEKVQLIIV